MGEAVYTPEPPPYLVACANCGPDKGCCGLILPAQVPGNVEMRCNKCGATIGTVATMAKAEKTLMRMAIEDGVCSEVCPHCGETNVFTGLDAMLIFTCRSCGSAVEVLSARFSEPLTPRRHPLGLFRFGR